jgi:hypothetical protein
MAARDPAVRSISSAIAAIERHHPDADTGELRRDLRAAQATDYVRQWVRETRARQGLPGHVTDPTTLLEFAAAVAEAMARQGGGAGE